MKELILSHSSEHILKVRWDGVRFAVVELDREKVKSVILLNPAEMFALVNFAGVLGEGEEYV